MGLGSCLLQKQCDWNLGCRLGTRNEKLKDPPNTMHHIVHMTY